MTQTTDLNDPAAPDGVPAVLRAAASKMREQAFELAAAWQDKGAGEPWLVVANELDRAASRIAKKV